MNERVIEELRPWKRLTYRSIEITFEDAVKAIERKTSNEGDSDAEDDGSPVPNIELEARPINRMETRWAVFNKATDKVAIFVHAMVWAFGTPFETGNFVPDGETPQNIPSIVQIKSDVSFMCEVSYGFDTSADKSIYTGLKTFEKLVTNDPRFNRHRLSRSTWQDGRETSSDVYIAVAKLFTKKGLEKPRKPVYDVHPWIERGLAQEGCEYVVNTLRPRLLACIGNATDKRFKIFTSQDQESFKQGDIVWFSFTVSFNVRKRAWTSEITPLELVRMGALTPMAIAEGEGGARPIPGLIDSDFTFLGEGENGDSEDVGSVPLELSGGAADKRKRDSVDGPEGGKNGDDSAWTDLLGEGVSKMQLDSKGPLSESEQTTKKRSTRHTNPNGTRR